MIKKKKKKKREEKGETINNINIMSMIMMCQ